MSVGNFNYLQYTLKSMAGDLRSKAEQKFSHDQEIKDTLLDISDKMNLTAIMMQKADYLLGGAVPKSEFISQIKEQARCFFLSNKENEGLKERLNKAISLLKNAECTGESYRDISERGRWKLDRDNLLNDIANA